MVQDSRGKAGQDRKSSQGSPKRDPEPKAQGEREARLAEALRANLRRRKTQTAARKDQTESSGGSDDDDAPCAEKNADENTVRNENL